MEDSKFRLQGVVPTLVVPLLDNAIHWDAFERELAYLSQCGVDGLNLGGGLGETAGLDAGQFQTICSFVRERVTIPLLVTILPDSEPEAYALLDAAVNGGANAICLAEPHYLFQTSTADLVAYFGRIRARLNLPLVLANTSPTVFIPFPRLTRIIREGLIDGVLQGGGDPHLLVDLLAMSERPPVLCAMEELAYTGLLLGAEGINSVLAGLFPLEVISLVKAVGTGDHQKAREIHERLLRLWRMLDHPSEFFARIRFALTLQGRTSGEAHAPFHFADTQTAAEVSRSLAQEGIECNAVL